jgi:hypothetical protein
VARVTNSRCDELDSFPEIPAQTIAPGATRHYGPAIQHDLALIRRQLGVADAR